MNGPNLGTRRDFYIHQLVRLTNADPVKLNKLNTNKLQEMEHQFYVDKYGWGTKKEYTPSTL